jgi:hypothetical protein
VNLGELRAWVLRTVKRPELTVEALDAINAAIEFASSQGDYAWDLVEGTLSSAQGWSSTSYTQSIVISTSFTRFRKMKYLRPTGERKYLKWQDSARIFDSKGIETVDAWYRAGDRIQIKTCKLGSSCEYAFYQYPSRITNLNTTNNYLTQLSACIHDLTAARMFEDIGNEAEAARLQKRGERFLLAMKHDRQDGVSHS